MERNYVKFWEDVSYSKPSEDKTDLGRREFPGAWCVTVAYLVGDVVKASNEKVARRII